MAESDQVVERLDRLLALLRLAFADQIHAATAAVMADPVNRAILDHAAEGWVGGGDLTRVVMDETKQANSTVRARISGLVEREALMKRGAAAKTEYRSSGLFL